jgi:nicotinate-nucleotide pyrophosphorylase (carboxylating)
VSNFDPPPSAVAAVVATALAEDFGLLGDLTSIACIEESATGDAAFVAREHGVLAGVASAAEVFRQLDPSISVGWRLADGAPLAPGVVIGEVHGNLRSILGAERSALNLLGHLSGIASLTRQYVAIAAGRSRIRDTRKTLPGLRALEKAAVRAGGGYICRESLSDAVLIKDNHLAGRSLTDAIKHARDAWPGRIVEVECDTLEQVDEAAVAAPDIVLLDNMTPATVATAVARLGSIAAEVSGGVNLATVDAYAAAHPAFISVGALTHSAPSLDLGLDITPAAAGGSSPNAEA